MTSAPEPDTARYSKLLDVLAQPKPFYGEGVWKFQPDELNLFLPQKPYRISLVKGDATADDLDALTTACQPATFGRNGEDIYDESYRKAGKLDRRDFATNIDVFASGLLHAVQSALFGWEDNPRAIRPELYKLNVYGAGSFFKAHKDTPRGEDMFGSLVLNFPVAHDGGALVLRHNDKEHVHDPSKANYASNNEVSWVAFFSDVEHEVLPVISGHRVTITYNLFYAAPPPPTAALAEPITQVLQEYLADSTFLPNGGRLGFGLSHQYPIPTDIMRDGYRDRKSVKTVMESFRGNLKGSDHAVFRAATEAGLDLQLKLVYNTCTKDTYLADYAFTVRGQVEDFGDMFSWYNGELVDIREWSWWDHVEGAELEELKAKLEKAAIQWVVPPNPKTRVQSSYVGYGNEASLETIYGDLVLIVKVPPAGER